MVARQPCSKQSNKTMRPLIATLLLAATADEQHAKHGIAP